MSYRVALRKNSTGEIRMVPIDWDWIRDGDDDLYWWTDGNYGCDCNRFLCFERADGTEPDFKDAECGEAAYTALYAELPDGTRVKIDGDSPVRT